MEQWCWQPTMSQTSFKIFRTVSMACKTHRCYTCSSIIDEARRATYFIIGCLACGALWYKNKWIHKLSMHVILHSCPMKNPWNSKFLHQHNFVKINRKKGCTHWSDTNSLVADFASRALSPGTNSCQAPYHKRMLCLVMGHTMYCLPRQAKHAERHASLTAAAQDPASLTLPVVQHTPP